MLKLLLAKFKFAPIHMVGWVLVWLFYVYFFSYATDDMAFVMWFSIGLLPITIIATYVVSYFLIPELLVKQHYKKFFLYLSYLLVSSIFVILLITFINFIFLTDGDLTKMPLLTRNFLFVFVLVYIVVGISALIKLVMVQYQTAATNEVLKNKILEGQLQLKQKELKFLKQQIQPHFLFNILNTIYGFALKNSEETPELILKLSRLLDYSIHQIEKPLVSIQEEIAYLESYIGLEQVRYRDSLRVHFKKDIERDIQIAPMLFIAFVENAFTHGGLVDGYLDVDISVETNEDTLRVDISNTVDISEENETSHSTGIAQSRQRLKALYPEKHKIEILIENQRYHVHIEIQHVNE